MGRVMDIPTISSASSYSRLVQDYRQKERSLDAEPDDQKQAELEREKQKIISDLSKRDTEVRAHEEAHANVGGEYASAPQYDLTEGPDGRQYATGGHVNIDVSEEEEPEDTVVKADVVERAALAPVQPSPQDFKVAGEARAMGNEARAEIQIRKAEEAKEALETDKAESTSDSSETDAVAGTTPNSPVDNKTENAIGSSASGASAATNSSTLESTEPQQKQFSFGLSFPQRFTSTVFQQANPAPSQAQQLLQRFDSLGLTYPPEPTGQQIATSA